MRCGQLSPPSCRLKIWGVTPRFRYYDLQQLPFWSSDNLLSILLRSFVWARSSESIDAAISIFLSWKSAGAVSFSLTSLIFSFRLPGICFISTKAAELCSVALYKAARKSVSAIMFVFHPSLLHETINKDFGSLVIVFTFRRVSPCDKTITLDASWMMKTSVI